MKITYRMACEADEKYSYAIKKQFGKNSNRFDHTISEYNEETLQAYHQKVETDKLWQEVINRHRKEEIRTMQDFGIKQTIKKGRGFVFGIDTEGNYTLHDLIRDKTAIFKAQTSSDPDFIEIRVTGSHNLTGFWAVNDYFVDVYNSHAIRFV